MNLFFLKSRIANVLLGQLMRKCSFRTMAVTTKFSLIAGEHFLEQLSNNKTDVQTQIMKRCIQTLENWTQRNQCGQIHRWIVFQQVHVR